MAHAFFPSDGRAHFDEDEEFTDNTPKGTNLLWVATHEFGHSLGIDHSDVQGAIMYPYYTGYVEGMKLHSDDIAAIQSLYGNVLEFVCLFVFFFSLLLFMFFTTTFMPCDSCSIIRVLLVNSSV